MVNLLADHQLLNVFERFMVEVIQELLKQTRMESFLELSNFYYSQINKQYVDGKKIFGCTL